MPELESTLLDPLRGCYQTPYQAAPGCDCQPCSTNRAHVHNGPARWSTQRQQATREAMFGPDVPDAAILAAHWRARNSAGEPSVGPFPLFSLAPAYLRRMAGSGCFSAVALRLPPSIEPLAVHARELFCQERHGPLLDGFSPCPCAGALRDDADVVPACFVVVHQGDTLLAFRGCACETCERVRELGIGLGLLVESFDDDSPRLSADGFAAAVRYLLSQGSAYASLEQYHRAAVRRGESGWLTCGTAAIVPAAAQAGLFSAAGPWQTLVRALSSSIAAAREPVAAEPVRRLSIPRDALTSHQFGVEVECLYSGLSLDDAMRRLAQDLVAAGIEARTASYGHDTRPHWKVTTDGSVSARGLEGFHGLELVSPIERALAPVETALRVLAPNARVNSSCGLHVHVDASAWKPAHWTRMFLLYGSFEPALDAIMPASRRGTANRFCRTLVRSSAWGAELSACRNVADIRQLYAEDGRYLKVNPWALDRHGTCEFRHHGPSTNALKVSSWVRLIDLLVAWALDTDRALPDAGMAADVPPVELLAELFRVLRSAREATIRASGYVADPPGRLSTRQRDIWQAITSAVNGRPERPSTIGAVRHAAQSAASDTRLGRAIADDWTESVRYQTACAVVSLATYYRERADELAQES